MWSPEIYSWRVEMKKPTYRFRATEIPDGPWTRAIGVEGDRLFFGSRGFTKKRILGLLEKKHGRFFCTYQYSWKLNKTGSITFERREDFGANSADTLPKRLVDRIRKWARSR
jgi:hypothetical protein